MKTYIGTKIIDATPESGPNGDEGYKVVYPDGYKSWSPKAAFEGAYHEIGDVSGMPPHQQRVVAERAELDNKYGKLALFFGNPIFKSLPESEKQNLSDQARAMHAYSDILARRIACF